MASAATEWVAVCDASRLSPERGVAALIDGTQVAIFRTFDGMLYAVGNQDPFSGAFVLSRGIVGSRADVATVASPLHKQVFDLASGRCLDDEAVRLPTYGVRECDGVIEVAVP
jgi:nitrite reductase (NADH) small subunit